MAAALIAENCSAKKGSDRMGIESAAICWYCLITHHVTRSWRGASNWVQRGSSGLFDFLSMECLV